MACYEYECNSCGDSFEIFHLMSQDPLKKCLNCGENTLVRLISSGVSVIIKGTKTPCFDRTKPKTKKIKKNNYRPFWRKSDKINKKILKNPQKYIHEGEI